MVLGLHIYRITVRSYTQMIHIICHQAYPLKLSVKAAIEAFRNFFKMNIKYTVKYLSWCTLKSLFSGPGKVTSSANPQLFCYTSANVNASRLQKTGVSQTVSRRPNYSSVYDPSTTSLSFVLPQANKCHNNSVWKSTMSCFRPEQRGKSSWLT